MTEVVAEAGDGAGPADVVDPVAASTPEWLAPLPDDLKGDATLIRYKDVEALAKAHIEAHKVAKSKVIVPAEDATDEQRGTFYDAIGRPASADDYDVPTIELPVDASDEQRNALKEATKPYRELAYQIGLTLVQAKSLAEFDLKRSADYYAKGAEEVTALEQQLGPQYAIKREAAERAFKQVFGSDDEATLLASEMDRKVGSARFVKGMMRLAEIMGEHQIIESDTVEGFGEVKDAEAKLTALNRDKSWRDKLNASDPTVVAQQARLLELAQKQALRRSAGAR